MKIKMTLKLFIDWQERVSGIKGNLVYGVNVN